MRKKEQMRIQLANSLLRPHLNLNIEAVNEHNIDQVVQILSNECKINPTTIYSAFSSTRIINNLLVVPAKELINSILELIFPNQRSDIHTTKCLHAMRALNLISKLKKMHKNEKDLFYCLSWAAEIISQGKIYQTPCRAWSSEFSDNFLKTETSLRLKNSEISTLQNNSISPNDFRRKQRPYSQCADRKSKTNSSFFKLENTKPDFKLYASKTVFVSRLPNNSCLQNFKNCNEFWNSKDFKNYREGLSHVSRSDSFNEIGNPNGSPSITKEQTSVFKSLNLSKDYRDFRQQDFREITDIFYLNPHLVSSLNLLDFSIFKAEQILKRKYLLPGVAYYIFKYYKLFNVFNQHFLLLFIIEITRGYQNGNPYHNDLHAADVLQMCHYMLQNSGIKEILNLSQLDICSFLISAFIHDYKHPGQNEEYLINSFSELSVIYNDSSILENFHVSEAFKTIRNNCNIFEGMNPQEYLKVRKIIMKHVLNTDIKKHKDIYEKLAEIIKINNINNGQNVKQIIETISNVNSDPKFITSKANPNANIQESKDLILSSFLFISNISNQARDFQTSNHFAKLIFEENFRQGDVERCEGLPITLLCDRMTVNIPAAEINFISEKVLPILKILVEIFPNLNSICTNLQENAKRWGKLNYS